MIFALGVGFLAGFLAGGAVAYVLTQPRRYRGPIAAALGAAVLAPYLASAFALARGDLWPGSVLALDHVGGIFWFGLLVGVGQVVFGRLLGRGFRSGD